MRLYYTIYIKSILIDGIHGKSILIDGNPWELNPGCHLGMVSKYPTEFLTTSTSFRAVREPLPSLQPSDLLNYVLLYLFTRLSISFYQKRSMQ